MRKRRLGSLKSHVTPTIAPRFLHRRALRHSHVLDTKGLGWADDPVWQVVLAQSEEAIALLAPDGCILYASPAALHVLGYTGEELTRRSGYAFVHPQDLPATQRMVALSLQAPGHTVTITNRVRHKDGAWRWVESRVTNMTHDPLIRAIVVNYRNITEQKQVEEINARLAAIVQSSDDAIIGKTLDGIITSWNAGAQRLYGYAAAEVIGQSIAVLIPPERGDELAKLMGQITMGQRVEHYDTVRMRKDGARIDVSVTISPIRDAAGEIVGASAIARDITERKRTEAALRERDTFFHTLLNHFPNGSVNVFDRDLRYQLVAGQGLAQVGLSADALLGKRLADVFPPDAVAYVIPYYDRAFQGETVTFELAVGGQIYLITAAPLEGMPDAIHSILAVAQNITERKQAETERIQLLEREQAARTATEAALEVRDTFLQVAAHELKTPLTTLLGTTQLLERRAARDQGFTAQNLRPLQLISAQARRLNALVEALLDISRIETGQLSIERRPVEINTLIKRVVREIQPTLERHTISCHTPDPLLLVEGDELRLEQVLHNLLQNAIKYSPNGGPVAVSAEQRGEKVYVEVSDRGMGIPEDAQARLFTRFYRAVNVEEHHISGMGIGLYVVKEILTLHGGEISVKSSMGNGSMFTVALPLLVDGEGA